MSPGFNEGNEQSRLRFEHVRMGSRAPLVKRSRRSSIKKRDLAQPSGWGFRAQPALAGFPDGVSISIPALQEAAPLPPNVFDSADAERALASNTNAAFVNPLARPLQHDGPHHVAGPEAVDVFGWKRKVTSPHQQLDAGDVTRSI
jgi:hypothetical protein